MRIVSGTHRSRRIQAPKNLPVRPTTDMAKEALFNVLNNIIELEGSRVLDLFAGTGNITYEFASRGAGSITSVDINYHCTKFIQSCSEMLKFPQIDVFKTKTELFLKQYAATPFDIVFADPPYDLEWLEELPKLILESKTVKPETLIIVEHPVRYDFSDLPNFTRHLQYGKVNFSLFEK